jgi:glycosyltransferase involved in cell wall biosynthesis
MLRVLHIIDSLNIGGAQPMLTGLCTDENNHAENVSHRVISLHGTGDEYFYRQLKSAGIEVLILARSKYNLFSIFIKLFYHLGCRNNYDLLHLHLRYSTRFGSLVKNIIASSKPAITSVYEQKHQSPHTYSVFSKLKSRIDSFVALSALDRKDLIATGIEDSKVSLILPNIDLGGANNNYQASRKELLSEYNLPENSLIVLCVARLHPDRLIHRMISILPEIISQGIPATLLLVGDGPLRNELVLFAKKLGVENHVRMAGIRYDIWNIFPGADLYLTFSVDDVVSFAAIQAMACACPVVAFNIKPMTEMEKLCEYRGYFITTKDQMSLTAVTSRFLKDEDLRRHYGTKAQQIILADETIKKDYSVLKYIELYKKSVAL